MVDYFTRYMNGDHEVTWNELHGLTENFSSISMYRDIENVAKETMHRVRRNVYTIASRLRTVGYNFAHPDYAYRLPQASVSDQVRQLENIVGSIPMSLKLWYELVGSVNLEGSHSSWPARTYAGTRKPRAGERFVFTAPLEVMSLDKVIDYCTDYFDEDEGIPLCGDTSFRAGFAGGGYIYLKRMKNNIDGRFGDTHSLNNYPLQIEHSSLFVTYLRRSFEWGGFPGFANVPEELRPTEMLDYLREGLLPI